MPYPRSLLVLSALCWLVALPLAAQSDLEDPIPPAATAEDSGSADSVETNELLDRTWIELDVSRPLEDVWIEITPLDPQVPGALLHLESVAAKDEPERFDPTGRYGLEPGPAMVCIGTSNEGDDGGVGIWCELVFLFSADRTPELAAPFYADLVQEDLDREDLAQVDPIQDDPPQDPLIVALQPRPGTAVVGRVVADGFAVPGTEIRLRSESSGASHGASQPIFLPLTCSKESSACSRRVTSDEDGTFRLPALDGGIYSLELRSPTGIVQRVGPFEVPQREESVAEDGPSDQATDEAEAAAEPFDLGEIVLRTGLPFSVRVTDDLGAAVEGASVSATQLDPELGSVSARGRSDVDGLALLAGLRARPTVTVSCEAPGHASQVLEFELLPVEVECVMPALVTVVGQVVVTEPAVPQSPDNPDEPEEAVAPSVLTQVVISTVEPAAEPRAVAAAQSGDFELSGLLPGPRTVTLVAPGFERRDIEIDTLPGEIHDLGVVSLSAAPSVEGRVVDPDSGEPVAGATVRVAEPLGADETLTDSLGRFRLATVGSGPLQLVAFSDDRPAKRVEWTRAVLRGDDDGRRIELPRGGWIRVLTGDPELGESPCIGCRILVEAPESIRRASGEVPILETDGQGMALSVPLPEAGYFVEKPRVDPFVTRPEDSRDGEGRFVRVRVGEISTVRFSAGEPLRVRVRPALDPSAERLILHGATWRQTGIFEPGSDGPGGLFRFDPSDPSGAELFLRRYTPNGMERTYLGPLPGTTVKLSVTRGPGATQDTFDAVDLNLWGSMLAGRLESLNGEPLAGSRVRLRRVTDLRFLAETRSDALGSFRIEHMYPGVYALWVGDLAYKIVSLEKGRAVDLGILQPAAESLRQDDQEDR